MEIPGVGAPVVVLIAEMFWGTLSMLFMSRPWYTRKPAVKPITESPPIMAEADSLAITILHLGMGIEKRISRVFSSFSIAIDVALYWITVNIMAVIIIGINIAENIRYPMSLYPVLSTIAFFSTLYGIWSAVEGATIEPTISLTFLVLAR